MGNTAQTFRKIILLLYPVLRLSARTLWILVVHKENLVSVWPKLPIRSNYLLFQEELSFLMLNVYRQQINSFFIQFPGTQNDCNLDARSQWEWRNSAEHETKLRFRLEKRYELFCKEGVLFLFQTNSQLDPSSAYKTEIYHK